MNNFNDDGSVKALIDFVQGGHRAQAMVDRVLHDRRWAARQEGIQKAFRAGWYVWGQAKQGSNLRRVLPGAAVALFLFFAVGCGDVTETSLVQADAGAGAAADVGRAQADAGTIADVQPGSDSFSSEPANDTGAAADVEPQADAGAPACIPADGCPSCLQAGAAGPGYATAQQCRDVIACVLSGSGGTYPWQGCHNENGGGSAFGGLACAQQLVKACQP